MWKWLSWSVWFRVSQWLWPDGWGWGHLKGFSALLIGARAWKTQNSWGSWSIPPSIHDPFTFSPTDLSIYLYMSFCPSIYFIYIYLSNLFIYVSNVYLSNPSFCLSMYLRVVSPAYRYLTGLLHGTLRLWKPMSYEGIGLSNCSISLNHLASDLMQHNFHASLLVEAIVKVCPSSRGET